MGESFRTDFRRFFGRGLGILLPTILTLWILWQAFSFVYTNVAEPINRATRTAVLWVVPRAFEEQSLPDWFSITDEELLQARATGTVRSNTPDAVLRRDLRAQYLRRFWSEHPYLNFTGFFIAILLIYLAGVLLGNFFGRQIYHRLERLIARIPGFKQVYPHVKQVVDLILGEKKMAFSKVVLVEYPCKGVWTLGFLTGGSLRAIDGPAGGRVVSVFIPTSPTPFTGFTINVLEAQAVPVEVSIEEALRFVITAGVLTPESGAGRTPDGSVGVPSGPRVVEADSSERASEIVRGSITHGHRPADTDPAAPRKGA